MSERRFTTGRHSAVTIKRDKSGAYLVGYASVFHDGTSATEYEMHDFTERIMPTAFSRSLRERADVYSCFNHDVNQLLGRTSSGTLQLTVDSRGLRYKVRLPSTTLGNDLRELAGRGDIQGSSFAFRVAPDGQTFRSEYGRRIREIHDVDLIECGPVVAPAYAGTTAGLSDRSTLAGRLASYAARAAQVTRESGRYFPPRRLTRAIAADWTPRTGASLQTRLACYRARAIAVSEECGL
jgi:HK97 family phage prohead protease